MSLKDINLNNADNFLTGAPHHWFKELRENAPVWFHPGDAEVGAGYWCLTKYDDVKYASLRPQIFSSAKGGIHIPDVDVEELKIRRNNMMLMDPPRHTQFRKLVKHSFTTSIVQNMEGQIRDRCVRIIDNVIEKGECEFVHEVAAELPLQIICDLMGVPQDDRYDVFRWANEIMCAEDPDIHKVPGLGRRARSEICQYGQKLGNYYSHKPDSDNLTARLMTATVDGEKLDELEFGMFFMLLLLAGSETTRTVTVNGMRLLIEYPDQTREIQQDSSLLPSAIEEFLRYDPAAHYFRRTATEDTVIRDQQIRAGDKVVLWYSSANRDEDVFDDADRFDIHRQPNDHLAFGIGTHFCLGAHLARLELDAIFREILGRMREIEIVGPVRRLRSTWLNGTKEMRVRFEPGARIKRD